MDGLLYLLARAVIWLLQMPSLIWVARIGRAAGGLAYLIDVRHRRVALRNLTASFAKEKSGTEIKALAKEHFRRLGENYACAIKTASMPWEELKHFVEFNVPAQFASSSADPKHSLVVAIGHFGNFELYARFGEFKAGLQCATTYRGLRHPSLNRLMQSLREQSGCLFFERRFDAMALKASMSQGGILLGLLADQHAGKNGLRLPFLGRDCSTSAAPAIFALRYHCPLHTGICYRIGLARWRIEAGPEIALYENGTARPIIAIMRDVNLAFEVAVRRDPANWFWVHERWKPAKISRRTPSTATVSATESRNIESGD